VAKIKLEVVTPTGKVVEAETDSVTAPGMVGELGIMPDHRPALIQLGGGAIQYEGGQVFVAGGVAEVRPDGVLVLAEKAVLPENIDRVAVEALLKESVEAMDSREYLHEARLIELGNQRAFAEAALKTAGH
jgi:F-type H+-transporting ATPase subunit epsilon